MTTSGPLKPAFGLSGEQDFWQSALRFKHSKLPTVCGKAPLHSSESGQGRIVPAPRGLGGAVFATTQLAARSCADRVGLDCTKVRRGGRRPCPAVELTELTSRPTQLSAQAKPGLSGQGEISGEPHSSQKAGLNGPPAVKRCYRGRQEATRLNP